MTVYNELCQVVHEGNVEDCFNWIMSFAEDYHGRKIYRTWIDPDGTTYFDCGANVFHV